MSDFQWPEVSDFRWPLTGRDGPRIYVNRDGIACLGDKWKLKCTLCKLDFPSRVFSRRQRHDSAGAGRQEKRAATAVPTELAAPTRTDRNPARGEVHRPTRAWSHAPDLRRQMGLPHCSRVTPCRPGRGCRWRRGRDRPVLLPTVSRAGDRTSSKKPGKCIVRLTALLERTDSPPSFIVLP